MTDLKNVDISLPFSYEFHLKEQVFPICEIGESTGKKSTCKNFKELNIEKGDQFFIYIYGYTTYLYFKKQNNISYLPLLEQRLYRKHQLRKPYYRIYHNDDTIKFDYKLDFEDADMIKLAVDKTLIKAIFRCFDIYIKRDLENEYNVKHNNLASNKDELISYKDYLIKRTYKSPIYKINEIFKKSNSQVAKLKEFKKDDKFYFETLNLKNNYSRLYKSIDILTEFNYNSNEINTEETQKEFNLSNIKDYNKYEPTQVHSNFSCKINNNSNKLMLFNYQSCFDYLFNFVKAEKVLDLNELEALRIKSKLENLDYTNMNNQFVVDNIIYDLNNNENIYDNIL